MQKNNHTDFILSPISDVLKEAISACSGIGSGIETYPLYNYIMQSVFLKMTGFQEQKMKCIVWEMATNNYDYRFKRFTQKPLGECSCYDDKNLMYQDLIDQIKEVKSDFDISTANRSQILSTSTSKIKDIFQNTNLSTWAQSNFDTYEDIVSKIEEICFFAENQLFKNCSNCNKNGKNQQIPKCSNTKNLKDIYSILYNRRNRYAHNTQSYQHNLPTFKTLVNDDYLLENYFIWFAILILIDEIFIDLFRKYLEVLE